MATLTDTSRPFTVLSNRGLHLNRQTSSTARSQKKPWQSRRPPSFRSSKSQPREDPEIERLSQEISRQSTASQRPKPKWWKIRLFRGMIDDVKRRLPYYRSDWRDAWDYRVIPATVYMYFAKYGHTFSGVAPPRQIPPGAPRVVFAPFHDHSYPLSFNHNLFHHMLSPLSYRTRSVDSAVCQWAVLFGTSSVARANYCNRAISILSPTSLPSITVSFPLLPFPWTCSPKPTRATVSMKFYLHQSLVPWCFRYSPHSHSLLSA
jgi:hypothetical protein